MSTPGDSVVNPLPVDTKKTEPKVKWQAIATYVVGVVGLAVFNAVANTDMLTALPDAIEIFITPILPVVGGLIAGYNASHQWRSGGSNIG